MAGLRGKGAALLAVGAVALTLAACGDDDSDSDTTTDAEQPAREFEGDDTDDESTEQPTKADLQKRQATAGTKTATATFSIGAGLNVKLTGGGGGTSFCTRDETAGSFTTKGNDERHDFGFYAKGDGSCALNRSWSYFNLKVTDSTGKRVGDGDMWFGQNALYGPFSANCGPDGGFSGIDCAVVGDKFTTHDLKITLSGGG